MYHKFNISDEEWKKIKDHIKEKKERKKEPGKMIGIF